VIAVALRSLVFPCQYHSFSGLYSYLIHLGSTLYNLSSDSIIKYSFASFSLLHAVTFFVAYLHSIQVPVNYYFLLVSIVIRLWARRPRNEGSISSRCKTFCSCPKHWVELWGPPSHLFCGYQGLFSGAQSGWSLKLTTSI